MIRHFFLSLHEIIHIPLTRLPLPLRIWSAVLVTSNAFSLLLLEHPEGRVVFACMVVSAVTMTLLHMKLGFVRILGLGHWPWFIMVPWIAARLSAMPRDMLRLRLAAVAVMDSTSLLVDTVDAVRFVRGEKEPYY